ncbi:hypothetical protein GCM10020331_068990 [Ectobacillus funiculus]
MAQFLDKKNEITPVDSMQLQRVPLIIHIPKQSGQTISKVSGQIDVKPTLLHLLGISTTHSTEFGTDLFIKEKDPLVVMRDGSFITNDYVYTKKIFATRNRQVSRLKNNYVNHINKKSQI